MALSDLLGVSSFFVPFSSAHSCGGVRYPFVSRLWASWELWTDEGRHLGKVSRALDSESDPSSQAPEPPHVSLGLPIPVCPWGRVDAGEHHGARPVSCSLFFPAREGLSFPRVTQSPSTPGARSGLGVVGRAALLEFQDPPSPHV